MSREDTQQQNGHGSMARRPSAPMVPQRVGGSTDSPEVAALAAWIMECMSKGRLSALGLGSRSATDASLSPIASWDQEDFEEHKTPEEIAEVIMAAAYRDVSSQRGTTRYVVNAYRDDAKVHFQKYPFRLDGGLEFTDKDEINYPPTEAGVLAMAMKHAEFAIRQFSAGQAEANRMLSTQVQELHRQNNKLAAQQYKVLDLQQQMLDRQAERDLAVREQDSKEKRKQMMFEKFLVLWPILAKRFFGGKDKGSDTLLAEEQLGTLLESFDEQQMQQMVPLFSDEQRVAFFTIYQEYKSRKKRLSEPGAKEQEEEGEQASAPEPEAPAVEPEPPPVEAEAQPQVEPEPTPESVVASAQDMANEAAATVPTELPAEPVVEVVGGDISAPVDTQPAPPMPEPPVVVVVEPEIDRTFEMMVEVLGDDLNDEKIGRLAEKLDSSKRTAFLAAVQAKRDKAASGG